APRLARYRPALPPPAEGTTRTSKQPCACYVGFRSKVNRQSATRSRGRDPSGGDMQGDAWPARRVGCFSVVQGGANYKNSGPVGNARGERVLRWSGPCAGQPCHSGERQAGSHAAKETGPPTLREDTGATHPPYHR